MTRLIYGLLALAALVIGSQDAAGQARTVRLASATLGADRIFAVLLPSGYAESEQRYPVVYLFHGGGQDHTAFMARTGFTPMARRHDVIVVMPAADRNYSGLGAEGQRRFNDFVASELVDYVDSHYRTIATPEGRAIAGLSMGGGIAAMTALQHPRRFGMVGAFSAALHGDLETAVRDAGGSPTYFYVSCGTSDSLVTASRQFVARLAEHKLGHEFREIAGGEHAWNVWDPEIATFFDLLFTRAPWHAAAQR
ncbi:MAG TPA: alpha/beta hydrolase-fold protein [Vicinamibacterales bacterium]|nr:alpha/beta hydrolase-fold protein [Vicinamibacterales bacterium]